MPIMDNPEVPPAVYVQIDHDVDAIRPIGPIKVTVTTCGAAGSHVDFHWSDAPSARTATFRVCERLAPIRSSKSTKGMKIVVRIAF